MARIIYIHTHSFGGERERKMWRFVRILCIWNQYANMLFMLRGVPSARNKEKGEIILYYGEIIFWLYYYGCGYFMKRRWIINCLTNQKGKRKQNGLSEKLIISHAVIRGLCNRVEGGREGSVTKGRLTLMVGDRWELGCLQGWQWLQRKRWACISSHRQCSQWEWRSSGALDLLEKGCQWAIRHSCISPWHSCLLGSSGHRQQRGRTVAAAMQPLVLRGDPAARGSSGLGCGLGWLSPLTSSPELMQREIRARQRMMTLWAKGAIPGCRLLGNYFLDGNCREHKQHFSLR